MNGQFVAGLIVGISVGLALQFVFLRFFIRGFRRYANALTLIAFGDHESLYRFVRRYNGPNIPPELEGSETGDAMYSARLLRYVAEVTLADQPVRRNPPVH